MGYCIWALCVGAGAGAGAIWTVGGALSVGVL